MQLCHADNCFGVWLTHWGWDKLAAVFQTIFSNEVSWTKTYQFCLRINNIPALVQIMAWTHSGDKPSSESIVASLLTRLWFTVSFHIYFMHKSTGIIILLLNGQSNVNLWYDTSSTIYDTTSMFRSRTENNGTAGLFYNYLCLTCDKYLDFTVNNQEIMLYVLYRCKF